MERYTEKHYGGGNGYYLICSGNCESLNCGDCDILDKIVDRFAAYEDTGLEPEEIIEMKARMEVQDGDYIEKEAAKEAILSWAVCINHPELLSKEDAMHCIDSLPAADVAEVRHGRWVYGEDDNIQCSVCGHDAYTEGDYRQVKTNYCPNCGARMDKEDDHDKHPSDPL